MKRRPEIISLLLLIFALAVIIILLGEMRRNLPKTGQPVPALPAGENYGIVDTSFVDLAYYFMASPPDPIWKISIIPHDTSFRQMDTLKNVLPQIAWAVRFSRVENSDTLATAKIGALKSPEPIPDKELAISVLHELMQKYEKNGNRLRIVRPVMQPAHHLLHGSYFVVVLPENVGVKRPVYIVSILPRGDIFYFIIATTSESSYPATKDDLQKMVSSFRPISFSIKSKSH